MQVLGIDIGGSGIKGAPVDLDTGQLLQERFRIETPQPSIPKAVMETVHRIIKHFDWKGSIGCGFPTVVINNIIRTAANIDKNWIGKDITKIARKQFNNEIYFINDADAAGLAEMYFGTGVNSQGLTVLLTIGTGIGSSVFYENTLIPNTEFGQLILNGKIAERYTSDAVRKKENLSWKKWGLRFNQYLKEIERLFWPNQIIVGGGMSKKTEKFIKYIDIKTRILPAKLKNEAGIIGAALATKIYTEKLEK